MAIERPSRLQRSLPILGRDTAQRVSLRVNGDRGKIPRLSDEQCGRGNAGDDSTPERQGFLVRLPLVLNETAPRLWIRNRSPLLKWDLSHAKSD